MKKTDDEVCSYQEKILIYIKIFNDELNFVKHFPSQFALHSILGTQFRHNFTTCSVVLLATLASTAPDIHWATWVCVGCLSHCKSM